SIYSSPSREDSAIDRTSPDRRRFKRPGRENPGPSGRNGPGKFLTERTPERDEKWGVRKFSLARSRPTVKPVLNAASPSFHPTGPPWASSRILPKLIFRGTMPAASPREQPLYASYHSNSDQRNCPTD